MKIMIVKNYEEMSQQACLLINQFVQENPYGIIGLATGHTPERTYELLITNHQQFHVDWSNITTFNLDEYIGLNISHAQSYHFYMHTKLFNHINIKTENVNIPNGQGDVEQNCQLYEQKIIASGGINLQLLGIGKNGHIAFNEPGTELSSITRVVNLSQSTIETNSRYFKNIDEVPKQAITMGLENIMQAQAIILLASGKEKAETIYNMVEGPITSNVPASILQNHDNVTVIIDQAAASKLYQELKSGIR